MASHSLAIPQRAQIDFPTQIVNKSLGIQNYFTEQSLANKSGGSIFIPPRTESNDCLSKAAGAIMA
jgi:hypothetical protein